MRYPALSFLGEVATGLAAVVLGLGALAVAVVLLVGAFGDMAGAAAMSWTIVVTVGPIGIALAVAGDLARLLLDVGDYVRRGAASDARAPQAESTAPSAPSADDAAG